MNILFSFHRPIKNSRHLSDAIASAANGTGQTGFGTRKCLFCRSLEKTLYLDIFNSILRLKRNVIYEWIAIFWYDWYEKLKLDLSDFWLVHFIALYVYVIQQKFPNTLFYIRGDTRYSSKNVPLKAFFNGKTSNNQLKLYAVKLLCICSY